MALLTGGCEPEKAQSKRAQELVRPVKIAVAVPAGNSNIKRFPGITEAARKSTLTFRVNGLVQELPIKAGQTVKKGDLIAHLDEVPYQNVINDRRAKFIFAEAQFGRQRTLYEKKRVAKAKIDETEATLKTAKTALDIAEEDLRHTRLVAPYDGVIAQVHIDNHQNIQAKEPVVQLLGSDNVDIAFDVPENLFLQVSRSGNTKIPFQISFNARPDLTFTAFYLKHDSVPDPTTRSYRVVVEMPQPDKVIILPGMSVNVEVDLSGLISRQATSDVLVPVEALFEDDGQTYVWAPDDDNFSRKVAVTVKNIEADSVRISDGLERGQRVIAAGVSQIHEGLKVRPLKRERGL